MSWLVSKRDGRVVNIFVRKTIPRNQQSTLDFFRRFGAFHWMASWWDVFKMCFLEDTWRSPWQIIMKGILWRHQRCEVVLYFVYFHHMSYMSCLNLDHVTMLSSYQFVFASSLPPSNLHDSLQHLVVAISERTPLVAAAFLMSQVTNYNIYLSQSVDGLNRSQRGNVPLGPGNRRTGLVPPRQSISTS